ncbi:class I SAM-dependent methyltransferase [Sphingomonas canadensis]|uniref:Class I SAM-dependent methyltransferase n=1 Tax=Sphingomonas canadensis TaxID=1219257 RepID=A0ABW3H5V5_9SPHN|nr:methyltransferase [Sphingomonas canadensis]MCW3835952.1 methyltransferase [Sphingomonas canadensis]
MKLLVPAALLALAAPFAAQAQTVSPAIAAALADPARPAADRERDAARHPGEILAFAGVKPGDKVADFLLGGGYWTPVLSALVGPKGHVYAFQANEYIAFRAAYADEQKAAVAGRANVTALAQPLAAFSFPEPLDVVLTVQNWHDFHLKVMPAGLGDTVAARLFAALKPGGVLLVADHVANPDPAMEAPQALHRIDPAALRAEIEKAGFVFEGETAILRDPSDPHTANVFAPEIRGKTDQFVYKFRKPA